jgi:hypothetical protein
MMAFYAFPVVFSRCPLAPDRRACIFASRACSLSRGLQFGHSLGAKLHLLIGADPNLLELASPVPRAANVLVAYNNFKVRCGA